jgi:hypothetical protein
VLLDLLREREQTGQSLIDFLPHRVGS